jgi:hypothetical protein
MKSPSYIYEQLKEIYAWIDINATNKRKYHLSWKAHQLIEELKGIVLELENEGVEYGV